jgi:tetratricopeptide (TPR) repeat protein
MDRLKNSRKQIMICLCLALAIGAVFGVAVTFDFLVYDDPVYVNDNHYVRTGFSIRGVVWAFTTTLQNHWHPVTMLSHMLDCQLFGLNPAGHHFTNILFHIFNTLLLFVLLHRMTKALWPSALVAALFALHPLNVETVAWIASRKDVLSTFFMLMTLWFYVSYAEHTETGKYLLALGFFAAGLLSKSMLVTLPFIMWLLDYWPLGRWTAALTDKKGLNLLSGIWQTRVLWEKLPFLFLSLIVGMVTYLSRQTGSDGKVGSFLLSEDGFIGSLIDTALFWQLSLSFAFLIGISFLCLKYIKRQSYLMVGFLWFASLIVGMATYLSHPMGSDGREASFLLSEDGFIGNLIDAANGYALYIWKMFFPINLSTAYLVTGSPPIWQLFLSFALLIGISFLCLKFIKRHPYLMVGWLWFLGMLLPVAGIYERGPNLGADRYVYIPLIGLFIMLSWGLHEIRDRGWIVKRIAVTAMILIMAIYSLLSVKQLRYWKDSATLFSRAIAVNPYNNLARENLGIALYEDGKLSEAEGLLKEVVRRSEKNSTSFLYLGLIASSKGQLDSAISYLRSAIEANPRNAEAHVNLGIALAGKKKYAQADESFSAALKIEPNLVKAHYNYAACLYLQYRDEEAVEELAKTLEIDPNFKEARDLLNSIHITNND